MINMLQMHVMSIDYFKQPSKHCFHTFYNYSGTSDNDQGTLNPTQSNPSYAKPVR